MSNEVYGYFESTQISDPDEFLKLLEESTRIGIKRIPVSELYNYPENMLPRDSGFCVAFIIGDRPGVTNTTYLTDIQDYAPESDIDLPYEGKVRLKLLTNFLVTMIQKVKARRFVVAITDSSQIEETKTVVVGELESVIFADFAERVPPDCLYDVVG